MSEIPCWSSMIFSSFSRVTHHHRGERSNQCWIILWILSLRWMEFRFVWNNVKILVYDSRRMNNRKNSNIFTSQNRRSNMPESSVQTSFIQFYVFFLVHFHASILLLFFFSSRERQQIWGMNASKLKYSTVNEKERAIEKTFFRWIASSQVVVKWSGNIKISFKDLKNSFPYSSVKSDDVCKKIFEYKLKFRSILFLYDRIRRVIDLIQCHRSATWWRS